MRQPKTARHLAARVLTKVDTDGAYANIELDKQLRSANMPTRERALATELVYGVMRWRRQLDYIIANASTRPPQQMAPSVRNILRMTAYQLLHLSQIPKHAAVNEAVTVTRALGEHAATGFVNAVARRISQSGIPAFDPNTADPETLAIIYSHPAWVIKRWINVYGLDATKAVLEADQQPAHLVIRVNTLRVTRAAFLATLKDEGIPARLGHAPDALIIASATGVNQIPGYDKGLFTIQDESSQLVAYALDPRKGDVIADLCSAPGGKATHLAQLMEDQGEIIAMELHPHRAQLVADTARRLGFQSVRSVQRDSRVVEAEWHGRFDRVLLDAPCMGTGVMRRRVDLRWRINADDLKSLGRLQEELLSAAALMIRPGGQLVYSTCSIEPEENQERVAGFLAAHKEFTRGQLDHLCQIAPALVSSGEHPELTKGELQLLPSANSDGFFLAALRREP